MNTSDVPPQVFRKSIDQVNKHLSKWPQDEWIPVGIDFELNLFTDGDGKKVATLYRVEGTKTLTNDFLRIWSQSEVEPRLQS